MFKAKKNKFKAFTLIEVLIATSLFTFVTFIALTTLFILQTLNQKAKITRNVYDNMYLVVDDIARETKYGNYFENTNYSLSTGQDCSTSQNCLAFEFLNNENLLPVKHGYFLDSNGRIYKYVQNAQNSAIYDTQRITTDDIKVESLKFVITGANTYDDPTSPDTKHPAVKFILKGVSVGNPTIPFYIESYLTQRISAN